MADLNKLLRTSADDLRSTLIPVGTWQGIVRSVKFQDSKTDKRGEEYVPVLIAANVSHPMPDVDPVEASKLNGEAEDETLFYRMNLYRQSDFIKLRKMLEGFGIQSNGRTLEEMAREIRNVPCLLEVEHEKYEGEDVNKVKKIYAQSE